MKGERLTYTQNIDQHPAFVVKTLAGVKARLTLRSACHVEASNIGCLCIDCLV